MTEQDIHPSVRLGSNVSILGGVTLAAGSKSDPM